MQTKFEAFFTKQYNPQIIAAARESKPLVVDFADLEQFDTHLADILLDSPISVFKELDNALSNIDTGMEQKRLVVRFKNLPERDVIEIKNLRSKHIKKLIAIKGLIKQASEVRPKITAATFECKSCGERIVLLQENESIETPYVCTCGNRRSFDLIMRKLIDHQRIIVEECPENLVGSAQPRKLPVYLRDDLVDPNFQKKVVPGNKIVITGILNDSPILTALKQESVKRDIYLDANHIETIDQEFEEIILTEEDVVAIKEFSKNPKIYELLIKAMAPSIYGYEDVKEAVALQLFGGVRKVRHDGITTRGDIHILLVGDPGAGKSQLLKYVVGLAPKARYIVGKSASGAGITATVVKDEFMRGWALEAGAIVLANNGIIGIDELDKMTPEDRSAMHEAMEQQTVTVSKANVQATLSAKTTVLAAANPKLGRFNNFNPLASQIDLPETLLSRFDLIFAFRDIPNKEKDTVLVRHILKLHREPDVQNSPIETEFLRKFIAHAKSTCFPKLTRVAETVIENFYVGLRNKYAGETKENTAVPIGARQLEAIIRLAEASAKVRLSDKVLEEDAQRAVNVVTAYLMKLGIDPETGKLDIDRLESGISANQRNKIRIILDLIESMQRDSEDKTVLIEDVLAAAEEQGIKDSMDIIQKMKREGELFEPKMGRIRKV
ncbi:MAG: minichromosome maintenance protein MCM [Nanoarchaeota archaeon]|nr:minichromosome maintenance protein MCM [Nanoarchaeota archaeon]MBU4452389.1 minichromosome maintenance protein MCM [Nanoarchaeota archaeon]